jgi:hypothetical protein
MLRYNVIQESRQLSEALAEKEAEVQDRRQQVGNVPCIIFFEHLLT